MAEVLKVIPLTEYKRLTDPELNTVIEEQNKEFCVKTMTAPDEKEDPNQNKVHQVLKIVPLEEYETLTKVKENINNVNVVHEQSGGQNTEVNDSDMKSLDSDSSSNSSSSSSSASSSHDVDMKDLSPQNTQDVLNITEGERKPVTLLSTFEKQKIEYIVNMIKTGKIKSNAREILEILFKSLQFDVSLPSMGIFIRGTYLKNSNVVSFLNQLLLVSIESKVVNEISFTCFIELLLHLRVPSELFPKKTIEKYFHIEKPILKWKSFEDHYN